MSVADHETDAKREVEALENPDHPHQDHHNADQAADNPHRHVECLSHRCLSSSRRRPVNASSEDLSPRPGARRLDNLICFQKVLRPRGPTRGKLPRHKRAALSARDGFSVSCGGLVEKYVRTITVLA